MTKWYIACLDKLAQTLVAANIERDFESLTCVLKDKQPCTWRLQLRKESSFAQYFLPNTSDGGLKNALLVQVDNEDGNGVQQVLYGPQTAINPSRAQDSTGLVVATGGCGLWYLKQRLALPTPHFPYPYYCTGAASVFPAPSEAGWYTLPTPANMKRFYMCAESSGSVATDLMGLSNGTYTAGAFTLGQAGLVDDPHTCVNLGGTAYIGGIGTTGLNSGNSAWSVWTWGQLAANPGANINAFGLGANPAASKQTATVYVDTSGKPHNQCSGASDVAGATALSLNAPHLLGLSWDGTTLTGWLDGQPFATQTPGTLSITYGNLNFGAYVDATGKWTGKLGMCGFYNGALSAATWAALYAIGTSRHAYLAYDTPGYIQASTAILYTAQRNAGASGGLSSYGLAAPSAITASAAATSGRQRPAPNLAMPTVDPTLGSNVYATARMDNLCDLLGAYAIESSPELTFKTAQSGSSLVFSVAALRDQSATAVFDVARSNISDYNWLQSHPPGNHVIAGGSNATGTPTARPFAEGSNDTTATAWEFATEEFVNANSTSDPNGLASAVNGALATDGVAPLNVNATLIDKPPVNGIGGLYFLGPGAAGYQLSDIVTINVDGYSFKAVIRQVQIDLQPDQAAIITPAIGTPDASIMQEFQSLQSNAANQGVAIANLQTKF